MALADTANLVVQLRLDDKFSGPLGRAQGTLGRFGSGMSQVGKGVGQVAVGLGRVGVVAAGAAAAGFATVTKLAGNFEAQLNTINTIAKLNEQDLRGVGEGIRETFRATGQPLDDLTNGYYDLLSAGVKVKDAQLELNTAVRLGIGGLGTTSEAVDLLTTAQNSYGLTAQGTAKAADIFAKAVEDGKVRISEISSTFANVAPTAKQFGVSIDEIGASYAFLTAKGVPAAEVTTQMNRAILDLVKPSTDAKKVLKDLGTTGEELIAKKGLVGALQALRDRADEMGIPFQKLFGRIEGFKFALQTTGPAVAGFNRELERMHDAAGTSQAQFEERQKGLNYQLGRLKALAQDAGITIGTALLPKIIPLLEKLNEFISKNQDKIRQFGDDLAEGFGKFADRVSDTDFTNFVNGLKTIASVGGKVVELFLRLPSGIQALILGGAAINRLSGGLVGQGVGNILGGAIKIGFGQFFARGASPANPMWVAQVGGPLGGGPGGAGGKGFWGKIGGWIVGGARTAAAAGAGTGLAIAGLTTFAGSNMGLSQQAEYLSQKLHEGLSVDEALKTSGATLAAVSQVASNQEALKGLSQEQIAQLKALANQPGIAGTGKSVGRGLTTPLGLGDDFATRHPRGLPVSVLNFKDMRIEERLLKDKNFQESIGPKKFIELLRRTSEFGEAGKGTTIEQGRKTGRDPLGDSFVALVKRVKNPLSPEVYREVSNHIIALEQVQRRLIKDGNLEAAQHAQRNIDKLSKLINEVDKTHPLLHRNLTAQGKIADRINEQRQAIGHGFLESANIERGIREASQRTANKNFSPSFSANIYTTVNAQLSTYNALNTINRVDNIGINENKRAAFGYT